MQWPKDKCQNLNVAEGIEGALLIGANLISWPLLHRWRIRWGATETEIQMTLPGDELVPQPAWSCTQANTIMYGLPLVELISCAMQRKMLLGIRQRAEMAAR